MRRTGVLVVGVGGRTAQVLIAGTRLMSTGRVGPGYGLTDAGPLSDLDLLEAKDLAWGGWDTGPISTSVDVARLALEFGVPPEDLTVGQVLPASRSDLDYEPSLEESRHDDEVERLAADIETFRLTQDVQHVVVVNLSNPPRHAEGIVNPRSRYAEAAVLQGCDFVEFTPTDTITDQLVAAARQTGSQLAGRDGSTGQTFLKLVLAGALTTRGLQINSWYSTNVLGNHDGLVLANPEFAHEKIHDKRLPLEGRLAGAQENHVVRIDYLPDRDDHKEAWDSVRLTGWLGSSHRLQVNWEGQDSYLAAPLVLDLVRLLEFGHTRGDSGGLRSELGPFFKNPLGSRSPYWWDQLSTLTHFYCASTREGA